MILAAVSVVLSLYIPILIGRGVDVISAGRGRIDFAALAVILAKIGICIALSIKGEGESVATIEDIRACGNVNRLNKEIAIIAT